MIVTVTPNPSLDRTLEVPSLHRGEVVRVSAARTDPGGKGANVTRALSRTGHASRAVAPVGGTSGEQWVRTAREAGLEVVAVPIATPLRTNLSLTEPDGTVTKVNEAGPHLTAVEVAALADAVAAAITDATWLATCGSLPPGAPDDLHAQLVAVARATGVRVAVDGSGSALAAAVDAGPDLIKPNVHELAELIGRPLHDLADVVAAADQVRARGVTTVVASLGADGAVLVDVDGAWHATTPPITVRSAVGAGDALVAGLLAAGGVGPDALRRGVASGAAAAQLPGTQFPADGGLDLGAVEIHPLDPDRARTRLTDPGGIR